MLITIADAQTVLCGRNPDFWVFLNANYTNADWNAAVSAYQSLESQLDDSTLTGILVCPERPNPQNRP